MAAFHWDGIFVFEEFIYSSFYLCVRTQEVDTECFPLFLSFLLFEIRFLSEARAPHLSRLLDEQDSGIILPLTPQH